MLHADDDTDTVSTGILSTVMVPKSIKTGRDPDTVSLVVKTKTGCPKSCIQKVDDDAIHIDLKAEDKEEVANAELRRFLCFVLDRVCDNVLCLLDWEYQYQY